MTRIPPANRHPAPGQEYREFTEKYGRAVGMNEVRVATIHDSLWTFGLCGCTATLAFRADGRVQVAHFDPTQVALHQGLVQAFRPVRLYVLSPGEYRRDGAGGWCFVQENPWNIGEVQVPYDMNSLWGEGLLARGLLYHRGKVFLPDRSLDYP